MRNAFECILDRVGEGVHRVDAPAVARVVVSGVADAVDRRVAQIDVGRGHVNLCAQHHRTVGMPAVAHLAEPRQVFGDRAIAKRAGRAGLGQRAAAGTDLLGALLIDIGMTAEDQMFGGAVHRVEVIAGVVELLAPVKAQPLHGIDDGIDVLLIFLFRVGVVEAQVAGASVVACQSKVQANALGMADMQVAVGFGRKARADARYIQRARCMVGGITWRAGVMTVGKGFAAQITLNDCAQEVARAVGFGAVGGVGRLAHGWCFRLARIVRGRSGVTCARPVGGLSRVGELYSSNDWLLQ